MQLPIGSCSSPLLSQGSGAPSIADGSVPGTHGEFSRRGLGHSADGARPCSCPESSTGRAISDQGLRPTAPGSLMSDQGLRPPPASHGTAWRAWEVLSLRDAQSPHPEPRGQGVSYDRAEGSVDRTSSWTKNGAVLHRPLRVNGVVLQACWPCRQNCIN